MTDPTCAACGHPRSNHPYRHRFVGPSLEDDVKDLEAKLAKAEADALRKAAAIVEAYDRQDGGAAKAILAEIKGESHD